MTQGQLKHADNRILILDTATLYYRAFYALPSSMLAPDGFPNNAVRGTLQTVERLIRRFRPRSLIAAWDSDWRPAWRVDAVPSYKTHRLAAQGDLAGQGAEEEPDELGPQVSAIAQLLTSWGVPVIGLEGYEADDIIGTLVTHPLCQDSGALVISGDRDLIQVVDGTTSLVVTVTGSTDDWPVWTPEDVLEKFGLSPRQYLDMAVLRGDPADGLPGIAGIGIKTATNLVRQFGTLEAVRLAALSEPLTPPMTARLAKSIGGGDEYLQAALYVSTVRRDANIPEIQYVLGNRIPASPGDAGVWSDTISEWGVARQADSLLASVRELHQSSGDV